MAQIHWKNAVSADFNTASDWSSGAVPGASDDAILDATGAPFIVTASTTETVNSIQLSSNATLDINARTFTATTGTGSGVNAGTINIDNNAYMTVAGALNNSGSINLVSLGNDTRLSLSGNVVLKGAGKLTLSDNANNTIIGYAAADTLTNFNNTISGAGALGAGQMTLVNQSKGVIDATATGNALVVDTSGHTLSNAGLLEGTGAAGLVISSTTVDDSKGGVISAGNGSSVTLVSSTILGGTISSVGTGTIQIADRGSLLDSATSPMTLAATVDIVNNQYLSVQGTIANTGAINLQSVGNDTRLRLNANTVLTGGGPITLSDNSQNLIDAATSGSTLTNVSSTISGAGDIGGADLVLINDKSGVVDATGANALVVQTAGTLTNAGVFEATGTGGLVITSTTMNGSAGGLISAGAGSSVTLTSATIIGGTLSSTGTGTVQVDDRGSLLDGATSPMALAATVDIQNNEYFYIEGAIANSGTINLQSVGNDTRLRVNANTTLTGSGQIVLSDNSQNLVDAATSGLTLVNTSNTLSGAGNIGGGDLVLTNAKSGVIDATGANALVLQTAGTLTNAGLLEASGAGGLVISGVTIAGAGGTILAAAGSSVTLSTAIVTGGFMSTASKGQITIANGSAVTLDGVTSDAGTILVDSTGKVTSLVFDKNTTLSGGGILSLSANNNNVVNGTLSTIVLTNVNDTIEGAGKLGSTMTLVNQAAGVIDANSKAGLTIATGAKTITNAGLIEASSKGHGTITSAISNTGTIEANGGTLTLKAAVTGSGAVDIVSGTLVIANTAAAEHVTFTGKTGKLELTQSQTYSGSVSGFSLTGKTSLDLRDIGFVSSTEATFSGNTTSGVLTVSDGTHTAHITLIGNYTASTFIASSDGAGGVTIVDPSALPPSVPHFAAATAGLISSQAASLSAETAGAKPFAPVLATPMKIHS
jgi:hypothetical protein